MNRKITVNITPRSTVSYPILMGVNLLELPRLFPLKKFQKMVIITDNIVKKRYGSALNEALQQAGYDSLLLSFPSGEKFKNHHTKQKLENAMLLHHCSRDTLIIAVGGGVVGDMAGFIAATFLRGIPYLHVPTTLLAMVDSSVGGKTAINTPSGKNLIGAIYQPQCVIIDTTTLQTLTQKAMINGLVEAIKMFLTHDAKHFQFTALHLGKIIQGEERLIKKIIFHAVKIKVGVIERDERETGERRLLNFGHTIGHALEKISQYKLLHGFAVAYGLLVEATISHLLGWLSLSQLLTIKKVLSALGIQGNDLRKFNLTQVLQATHHDKKVRFNTVHYTLLKNIGCAYTDNGKYMHPVSDTVVKQAFKKLIGEAKHVG